MNTRLFNLLCLTAATLAATATCASGRLEQPASAHSASVVMGYADYLPAPGKGFKALIFDDGTGFVFRSAAPNRINTWKIRLSATESNQLCSTFYENSFFALPAKMKGKRAGRAETALFIASDDRYHEVKNYACANTAFDTIRARFRKLVADKARTATRVPITQLLEASKNYQSRHPADSAKTRLVRNITSDFCRSLASKQDIDYDLAKGYFLPNRYLSDVDPSALRTKTKK
jgi:hypothetical protein